MSETTGTQALDRAVALLRLVVGAEKAPTYTELVREADLARSTTSRLLNALERGGLLERDRDGGYRGGPLFAEYAQRFDRVGGLVAMAHPVLEDVAEQTGETVNLAVPRHDEVQHVAQIDSRYVVGAANWLSVDVPGHCSALGKVLYAWGALRVPRGHLERRTEHTVPTRAALERELEKIRQKGFSETQGELEPGLDAIAAPVRGPEGHVIAAIGVSGPTFRIGDHKRDIAELLVRESTRLTKVIERRARA
ncbi:IclR family transcriptional regulator [Solicola sp. PLA-1-18]|uniref:IclR family transcriptional regulator n=1 Tax=Solicola sp. PLA-1-18 TaxID=3380532 RepID=UPI003B76DCC5